MVSARCSCRPAIVIGPFLRALASRAVRLRFPAELWANGYCSGFRGWNTRPAATPEDLQRWQQMGVAKGMPANVSIRTGVVPDAPFFCSATDVDVECPDLASKIVALARKYFGRGPRRTRAGSPRAILLYRATREAAALSKIPVKFIDRNGREHLVEILLSGSGPQFIADGLHPSGVPYEWPDGYPVADDLPEISAADIEAFLNALRGDEDGHGGLLQREGCTLITEGSTRQGCSQKRESIGHKQHLAPSHDVIAEALNGFANTPENVPHHEDFVQMTAAIKAACGGDESFYPDFEAWAMEFPGITNEYIRARWVSIRDAAVGWNWLWRHTGYAPKNFYGWTDADPNGEAKTDSPRNAPSSKDTWEAPTDFWADDPSEPPNLPEDVVPAIIEGVARDHASRLGVEAGAPAAALVTAMGSLVHAGNRLQMRQNDTGWTVRPILWTAIISDSGANKTSTLSYALDAVRSVDVQLKREYALALRKFNAQRQTARRKPKADEAPPYEGPGTTDILFEPEKPRFRQKIINNATTEAIAAILADNSSGVLSFRDELSGFFGAMDAYHQKGGIDRPFWLEAKDGGSYTVNRRTSDPIIVENNAVSVLGAIQPDKFRDICKGLTDDGMLQRFAPIFLRPTGIGEDVAPNKALADSLAVIASILIEDNEPRRYRFTPEADQELRAHQQLVASEIQHADALPAFRQWLNKSVNEFGRLALVFHVIEWLSTEDGSSLMGPPPELVSLETARRARRYLTEFIYPHALAFYRGVLGSSPIEEDARWIAGYILTYEMALIANRDIQQAYTRLKKPEKRGALIAAMQYLHENEWIRPVRGQPPTSWTVNPVVHVRFAERARAERERRGLLREKIQRDVEIRRAKKVANSGL